MKKFFHSHPNIIIGTLAVIFIGTLASFYFWAIGDVFQQVGRALAPPVAQDATGFNLLGASKLDLRGLLGGTPSAAPTSTPAPASASASTSTPTPPISSSTTSSTP